MKKKIAIAQMTSTDEMEDNYLACKTLAKKASELGACLLCLPENFAFMGKKEGDSANLGDEVLGRLVKRYRELAKNEGIWLSLGGIPEKSSKPGFVYNSHLIIDCNGEIRAKYRKINLFTVEVDRAYSESDYTLAGKSLVTCDSPIGTLGLSICYDLRFAELYGTLRNLNAQVLLVPAAFTFLTGQAHWKILCQARAIENQCYVIAAAQGGKHNETRTTFGHGMVIDPWGVIIAETNESENLAFATLDFKYLERIRIKMPLMRHDTRAFDQHEPV